MNNQSSKGSCLCGDVHYELTGNLGIFQYCHCSRCRKFTGSAHASNLLVSPDQFRWVSGESLVGSYSPKETKHFATAFCKQCGSSLPWHAKSGKAVVVPAGTLDTTPSINPFQNIFCSSKASWYKAPNELSEYNELPSK
ncbi:GFA family protein [Microbulbifer spongiae]|uniref:GFA family protein n=1 Tax=Microbulbifer spongiae TaxID=2944933 RepID=A0ABY9E7E6_9GAMM|nr:GFA family protein [Microbulbifer sp. MI-G]WKD48943.1 GFA family protein [Microbulbifer sp. MI-G]